MDTLGNAALCFFFVKWSIIIWDVTEKVWLRAMYSDGIAAQTRKTEGDPKTEG